ncbi:unnamed protein product, partial [Effrenium voratum]
EEVLDLEEGASSGDEGCDRFANMSAAKPDLSYRGHTVHFWTIPYSAIEGRLTAENTSKKGMLRRFQEVYGEALEFYAVFRELHAESSRSWERKAHYHVVLKLKGRVRWIQIARELRARGIFGHLSLPTRYADIWRIVAYCYVPSARKPLPELDPDPLLSSNFPIIDMEKRLRGKLARTQVLRPWDFFQVLRRHPSIETYNDLIVWAQSQQKHGVPQYLEFMTRQGGKMSGLFKAWKQLMAKPVSQKSQREERLASRQAPCSCTTPGRLRSGLDALMELHEKDGERFGYFVKRLIRIGTAAKNCNILLCGASNAGKTALTRQNSCPVAWDTLLLLLEGEAVVAACKGSASVVISEPPPFLITCQERVVPLDANGRPNVAEKDAFHNRFALRWHLKCSIPSSMKDSQRKMCYRCVRCYSDWVDEKHAAYAEKAPDIEAETAALESAICQEDSRVPALQEEEELSGATTQPLLAAQSLKAMAPNLSKIDEFAPGSSRPLLLHRHRREEGNQPSQPLVPSHVEMLPAPRTPEPWTPPYPPPRVHILICFDILTGDRASATTINCGTAFKKKLVLTVYMCSGFCVDAAQGFVEVLQRKRKSCQGQPTPHVEWFNSLPEEEMVRLCWPEAPADERILAEAERHVAGLQTSRWVQDMNYSRGVAVPTYNVAAEYRRRAGGQQPALQSSMLGRDGRRGRPGRYLRLWAQRFRAKWGLAYQRIPACSFLPAEELVEKVLSDLETLAASFPSKQLCVVMDSAAQHLSERVVRRAADANIWLCVVPPKATGWQSVTRAGWTSTRVSALLFSLCSVVAELRAQADRSAVESAWLGALCEDVTPVGARGRVTGRSPVPLCAMSGSSGSFTRSSSSSSTSSDSLASSEVPEHPAEEEVLDLEEGEGCDRFANMSAAKPDLSYRGHTVHFWTIPYSAIEGRLTAENTSKKGMLRRFREVYGEALEFYAVFRELHAESSRSWERKAHYHVVLKLKGRVRWIQIARELRARGIFGKPLPELDPDPLLSSNFPIIDMEKRLRGKLARTQVLRPGDFFQVLRRHPSIETYNDLIVWAQSQQKHGVPQYVEFMTRQGGKMSGLFKAWKQLMAKPVSQKSQREERLRYWQASRQAPCSCTTPGRLRSGLDALMVREKDGERFGYFVKRLIRIGTAAKNCNILLCGASNAGKTALTRQNSCPVAWDTLLLLLEGEAVVAACKGSASVVISEPPPFLITCQERVVPLDAKGRPNVAEKDAFHNRFALRWHLKCSIPSSMKDSQRKMCYRCVRCYSDWVDEKHAAYAEKAPDIEAETAALESAICQEDSRVPALQEEEELSGATTQPLLAAQSADPRSSQLQPSGAAVRPQPAQLDELNPAEELKGDGSEPFQDRRVRPRLEPAVASSPAPAGRRQPAEPALGAFPCGDAACSTNA